MTLAASGATRVVRALRILLVLGLVLAGLAAALPFRRAARERSAAELPRQIIDVPLRRPDVALEVSPASPDSPAAGLRERLDHHSAEEAAIDLAAHRVAGQDLESLAPPPSLPPDFAALAAGLETSRRQWQPARMKLPSSSPSLRRHRLTDGDSLERLAERYLGSAERAGEIYDINRDVLAEPDLLPLGRIIRIPAQND
jgi:nucleoid-associated protein YgaU